MKEELNKILNTFENDDIKRFAQKVIDGFDPYVFLIPASSTGKYHPQYSLGNGGLIRHTIAVVRILNYLFEVEWVASYFSSRERDLLRVAAIAHDSKKSGDQEDYEKNKNTRFIHPILAATAIRKLDGIPKEEIEFIAHVIESHMGQWNTDKRFPRVILPKPQDKYQAILHVADYLASRQDIDIKFEEPIEPIQLTEDIPEDPKTWIVDFGKHKGMTIEELICSDPDYIEWMQNKKGFNREPCKSILIQLGYEFV